MAPSFLSKLVKVASPTSNRERGSSESSPRASVAIPRSRSQSISQSNVISPTTPTPASTLNSKNTQVSTDSYLTATVHKADSHQSLESVETSSTQPNVTIVPPSPLIGAAEFSENDDDDNDEHITTTSVPASDSTTIPSSTNDKPSSPPITPNQNTKRNMSGGTNPATVSNASLTPGTSVHKKKSNQSMKSVKKVPSELSLNANHSKAATAPADIDSEAIMTPIVESPTDIKFPAAAAAPVATSEKPNGGSTVSLVIQRYNTEISPTNGKGNRPWRKSATRKPTGLASAIAASGLAMANPALSPSHQAQISPPIITSPQQSISSATSKKSMTPSGSPPYMSLSAQSSTSQQHLRTKSAEFSPKSPKSKKSANGSSKGSRPRKKSVSANSDNGSEYYGPGGDEVRPDYYSNLDSSGEDDSGSDLDSDDLELGDDDIPVTGFAVASNKRNADFHELFPTVPEGDYLIEDYGCALQREILIQGRLYISENHICFHANIFGWITDLSIPIYEITSLEKKMTAFVIPNAIQLSTRQAKYSFASFLSRDTTFDVIYNIWRLARPEDAISIGSRGRSSIDGPDTGVARTGGIVAVDAGVNGTGVALMKKPTSCVCGKEGKHYTETAMDTVIPGTPDRIHNLMFASGFMKDFMAGDQKLLDIQMSDWSPVSPGSKLLTRNMSYVKPLTASLGPKQTKCEITDEMVHVDFDDYVSTITTTRTPDVPSGGVFSVKTRTCVTWASPVSSRVLVTTQVEWTGRSFIKGIIERSAIDGQKVYHSDLEKAMRVYIQEHQSEFLPEGIDPVVIDLTAGLPDITKGIRPESPTEKRFTEDEFKQRERERNQRGLQWAWDTFEGASQVARQSTKGALELIRDAWDQSSSTTILWFVIVILVLSNLWTLMRMGAGRDEASRKLESRRVEEREKWVQSIVTALWEELSAGKEEANVLADNVLRHHRENPTLRSGPAAAVGGGGSDHDAQVMMSVAIPVEAPPLTPVVLDSTIPIGGGLKRWEEEVEHLCHTLDVVEQRVKAIRESLAAFKSLDSLD